MNASGASGESQEVNRGYSVAGGRAIAPPLAPGLHVVATPIGNLKDITLRALETLAAADTILAEDTRQTAKLLQRYAIRTPLKPYHEHNAEAMRPRLLERLRAGAALALVSDAGTPLVSDPGVKLVRDALDAGVAVHPVPGPSAALAALVASGLMGERFLFAGFPPSKRQARRRFLQDLADENATIVLFESPHRVRDTLNDMVDIFGPRREAAACRELTKLHEEVLRGPLADLAHQLAARQRVRGEFTLVVAPPVKRPAQASDEAVRAALAEALEHQPAGKAAAQVARRFGLKKRALYDLAVRLSQEGK